MSVKLVKAVLSATIPIVTASKIGSILVIVSPVPIIVDIVQLAQLEKG